MSTTREAAHYVSSVVTVEEGESVTQVAEQMDRYGVGCVVVTDAAKRPVGIVTDRDLLRRVVVAGRDAEKTTAAEVMTRDPATASTREPLEALLGRMVERGVRRLPVVSDDQIVGVVTLDDVVAELGRELGDVRTALRKEVIGGRDAARKRHRREEIERAASSLGDRFGALVRRLRRE